MSKEKHTSMLFLQNSNVHAKLHAAGAYCIISFVTHIYKIFTGNWFICYIGEIVSKYVFFHGVLNIF